MIGETISHYRILQRLGSGGMGEVYEAEDPRLGRRVALKFLPRNLQDDRASLERFQREARAASQINHHNICTIYDVAEFEGRPFLVMELLEGESLKTRLQQGPLPLEQVLNIGIQVADALDAAHSQGVIHRDIKPGNIFISPRGQVKILDFGLAKLTRATAPKGAVALGGPSDDDSLTALGLIPGTAYYMSPEQARNEELDARTDIFSLGVVLYEMATGQKPFAGKSPVVTLAAILDDRPVAPSTINPALPPEFEAVVAKALEKKRDRRYASAAEMRNELLALKRESDSALAVPVRRDGWRRRAASVFAVASAKHRYIQLGIAAFIVMMLFVLTMWWARNARRAQVTQPSNTVAVLPLQNAVKDLETDYLRFAIADEISTALTYTPGLEVRPIPADKSGDFTDPARIGRDLRVAYVISGHYVRQGGRLIVNLQAVDVAANRVAWQGTFNFPPGDYLAMQRELASQVRRGLLPVIGGSAGAIETATKPSNREAYDLYLRSIAVPHDPIPSRQAIVMLERSVALDPGYAPAWDALGLRYYYDAQYSGGGYMAFDRAVAAYERAVALDPNFAPATAHLTRTFVERGELETAYEHAEKLLKARPDNLQAHFTMSYVLRYAGLLQEAAQHCDRALAIDPGNYAIRSCAFTFAFQGRTRRAMDFVALDAGSSWALNVTPWILLRGDNGRSLRDAAARMSGESPWFGNLLQACLDNNRQDLFSGMVTDAEPILLALRDPEFRYLQGSVLAYCGQRGLALRLLKSAVDSHYCATQNLERDPLLDNLRDMPDFDRLKVKSRVCQRGVLERVQKTESATAPAMPAD
ncbi:MAG TPA: protein kinase [Candidatus Nanoarchaeia archaeon]|nr:protein kinase [Candidatus Nanoarchaeia archaeon]